MCNFNMISIIFLWELCWVSGDSIENEFSILSFISDRFVSISVII